MKYWALAADPRVYRIMDAVQGLEEDWWGTGGKDFAIGDRVVIWKYGGGERQRGVVALGEVLTDPEDRPDVHNKYWVGTNASTIGETAPRVRIRYTVPSTLPLWHDPSCPSVANELSVSRAHGGRSFIVTEDQWYRLLDELGEWPESAVEDPDGISDLVDQAIRPGRRGQGRRLDAVSRRVVELRAMALATTWHEERGWSVLDVSSNHPYDLECSKGGEVRHVEVKGTTGGLGTVFLTRGEVESARDNPGSASLAVAFEIELYGDGAQTSADGGDLKVFAPWRPGDEDLLPIAFRYRLPGS